LFELFISLHFFISISSSLLYENFNILRHGDAVSAVAIG
jgi:hypothetical protein